MEEWFYEQYAEAANDHWWFRGRRAIVAALLERELGGGSTPRRILDVGCGTGGMLPVLAGFGETSGVDSEPQAVEYCRNAGGHVQLATATALPFENATFEVATLLDVIEHSENDRGVLSEASRVLAPGGLSLVTVPAYDWMWGDQDEISHHFRRYTRGRLRGVLEASGLRVSRAGYFNSLLFGPIAAIRVGRRLRPAPRQARSDFALSKPGRRNDLLSRAFASEAWLCARGIDLPFGVSAFAIARKPG